MHFNIDLKSEVYNQEIDTIIYVNWELTALTPNSHKTLEPISSLTQLLYRTEWLIGFQIASHEFINIQSYLA